MKSENGFKLIVHPSQHVLCEMIFRATHYAI